MDEKVSHSLTTIKFVLEVLQSTVDDLSKFEALQSMCFDCESQSCGFNHNGECRFVLIHEKLPQINDEDGCREYYFIEGDDCR